jgi:hypothetical protein
VLLVPVVSDPHARLRLTKGNEMLKSWHYILTLTDGRRLPVVTFSDSRDPSTVIRMDLRDQVMDVETVGVR